MIQAFLAGNLGKDAELRHTPSGEKLVKFSVACSTGKKDETQWVECTMWGDRGEKLVSFLVKGKTVAIVGRVTARAYDSKGEARASLEVRVDQLTLLGGGSERREERAPAAHPTDDWT